MSILLRAVLQGLGWELGRTAASEAVDSLKDDGDREERKPETDRERRAREKTEAKAERAEAKRRAAEAKAREREVDRELAALEKRLKD